MLKKILMALLPILFHVTLFGQKPKYDPDSILVGNRKQPQVMLVGVFHFNYPNLDAHITKKEDQVNILEQKKQKELMELVNYIAKFKPTKIAVETGTNTGFLMTSYREYLAGGRPLAKTEIEQLGFRLMQKFNLDTIYGVDAWELMYSMKKGKDSTILNPIIDSIYNGWTFRRDYGDSMTLLYKQKYSPWFDKLKHKMSLLDYIKLMNSEKFLQRSHGSYFNGNFTLDGMRGADALTMHWYSRNIRIFRKIQQITTSPNDRILVIFGAGHVPILKHIFESTPQYKLQLFGELK
jgi:hypothetical protein